MKMNIKKILEKLLTLRMVEEEISKRYVEQEMRCPIHLSIGQEACAVGICENLTNKDQVYSTHRCHSHYLAKGGNLNAMIAEMYGKSTGCCGGRGGSMHLMDHKVGMMMSLPIVSSIIPVAVGAAMALKFKKKRNIAVVFIGDASLEEGVFHESANFASLHNIPVLFVCENNRFSCFTQIADRQPSEDFTRLAKCHGIDSLRINGNNVLNVIKESKKIISDMKKKKIPFFLQLDTYRFLEHCGPNNDDYLNYRERKEVLFWKNNDPVEKFLKYLKNKDKIKQLEIEKIYLKIRNKINIAFLEAKSAEFPSFKSLNESIYAK